MLYISQASFPPPPPLMESLISTHFPALFAPPRPPLNLTSPRNPSILKLRRRPNLLILFCSTPASPNSIPSSYAGWDDDIDAPTTPGKPDPLQALLITAGINRKQAFVFFLGFVTALVIFRARFSSMVVVPISVIVFAAGFSAGAARASGVFGLLNQIRRRDGEFAGFDEKAKEVGEFLDDLGTKMSDLKHGLEGAIEKNSLDVGSIKSYLDVVEVVRSVAVDTKKSIEESIDGEARKRSTQKGSRKRREEGFDGFDFGQHIGSMFDDYLIGLWPQKLKPTSKAEVDARDSSLGNSKAGKENGDASRRAVLNSVVVNNDIAGERNAVAFNGEESRYARVGKFADDMLSYDDELNIPSPTKKRSFEELVFKQIYKGRLQNDVYGSTSYGRSMEGSMDFASTESESSSMLEETLETRDESYFFSQRRKTIVSKNEQDINYKRPVVKPDTRSAVDSEQPTIHMEEDNKRSSSKASADEEFNRNVKEATNLLKLAKECIVRQADEEKADAMLYQSVRLLSIAVALKPMSLLAVGQLGNSYLLHGELKLRVSRELRTLMFRSDSLSNAEGRGPWLNKFDSQALSRENITPVLVDVCEECDGLLVEAGRKYRKALAIDGSDIRSLYNWGLALSFRAQLIADIGPEAAMDADKVYLAAIDKFNAMMSRNNAYAPDALYRWGLALQQRSHLRPDNSREKMKLLQQAKSLFEEVLCVESNNKLVRQALASCLSDLDYGRR